MARVSNKHNLEQNLDFQGFLSDLQDWELSLKEKDKKLKPQSNEEMTGLLGENNLPTVKTSPANYSRSTEQQKKSEYSRRSKASNHILSTLSTEESSPNANSEKELGNEYFKQKEFKEAIDCYSRSIALSPTAVAYANRAMAYLKIKRFEEAENDCTEALDLDDRYIKAYSRRATARKELGKFKASIEDSEFALRLEPQNQEIKKQHAEAKALYEKEIFGNASRSVRKSNDSNQGAQIVGVTEVQTDQTKNAERKAMNTGTTSSRQESGGSLEGATPSSGANSFKSNSKQRDQALDKKQDLKTVQELASRAASRAMAEAAKKVSTPKSAYQFEVSWRGISGDRALQAHFLKAISPATLPQLFKNALSAPILIDIVKCISTFFMEDIDLAISFLDNLTNVSRFDMIVMCLSAADKADLNKIWEELFLSSAVSPNYTETLSKLRLKYCPGDWKMHVLEDSNSFLIKEM